MENKEYSDFVRNTTYYPYQGTGHPMEFYYLLGGLLEEAGEALGVLKKIFRDCPQMMDSVSNHMVPDIVAFDELLEEHKEHFEKELGDTHYYFTALLQAANLTQEHLQQQNFDKIMERYNGDPSKPEGAEGLRTRMEESKNGK